VTFVFSQKLKLSRKRWQPTTAPTAAPSNYDWPEAEFRFTSEAKPQWFKLPKEITRRNRQTIWSGLRKSAYLYSSSTGKSLKVFAFPVRGSTYVMVRHNAR